MTKIKQTIGLIIFTMLLSQFAFSQQGIVTIESSPEIKALIQKKIAFNKEHHATNGFRIQLFYGSEKGANNASYKCQSLFPQYPTYVDYDSPDWKVRVGNFKKRLEADRALQEIIVEFGDAIVIRYKI